MAIGLLGRKVGMTQVFDEAGTAIPVTVIEAGPCPVLQLRTADRDGYEAVQLGFSDMPRRLASRSRRGHVAKLDSAVLRRGPRPAWNCRRRPTANRNDSFVSCPGQQVNWLSDKK